MMLYAALWVVLLVGCGHRAHAQSEFSRCMGGADLRAGTRVARVHHGSTEGFLKKGVEGYTVTDTQLRTDVLPSNFFADFDGRRTIAISRAIDSCEGRANRRVYVCGSQVRS